MDTPSHFFNDCMDFGDPNPYQSPEQDAADASAAMFPLHQYTPHDDKLALEATAPSLDGRLRPRMDMWGGFADQFDPMAADQKPLFVDPGLYDGESENDEIKAQIQVLSMEMSRPSTRRASSSKSGSNRTTKSESASTDITPPDQEPPKKRKSRKAKRDPENGVEEHKRSKFLERNRIAASKCREKKKQYVSDLEETKIGLETQHAHLQMEYNGLLGEVSGLKHHLMTHAKCNDPNIDRWLNNEATRFVQTSNEIFGQPFGQFPPTGTSSASVDSPRSRNPSIASAYQALQGVQFDPVGSGERQGSISYSHGSSLYTSPTDSAFPCLNSPHPKREPDINYNHMPDIMFSPEQPPT
ncbi:hypothetical protein B0T16DRAFT_454360 [Cercophora newfieldiana]|uniref:BZIP domain-containing protein n=1 Tax=Cercophora newfieldiana TaxID=92897 RepID=A0AA39YJ36_9PEZI|nr:hypothetical protein B0T16DRAFT_454360 [Cercophora newfieldiana]